MASQIAIALSVLALAAAVFALLVALGTASRVARLNLSPTMVSPGLDVGTEITPAEFSAVWAGSKNAAGDDGSRPLLEGPTLICFVSSECSPCRDLVQSLNQQVATLGSVHVVMVEGSEESSLRESAEFRAEWKTDTGRSLRDFFRVTANPTSFLVVHGRVVASGLGPNVRRLLETLPSAQADRLAEAALPNRS